MLDLIIFKIVCWCLSIAADSNGHLHLISLLQKAAKSWLEFHNNCPFWLWSRKVVSSPWCIPGDKWHSDWPVSHQPVRMLSFIHSCVIQNLLTSSATVHKFLMNVSITINGHWNFQASKSTQKPHQNTIKMAQVMQLSRCKFVLLYPVLKLKSLCLHSFFLPICMANKLAPICISKTPIG